MASVYSSFLQSPNPSHLAENASLNYITTTTSFGDSNAIIKHLQAQQKQVNKKDEKILNAIEGPDSLVLETETTFQFNDGGGAYLPSMDSNLLDEKLVTFPLIHIVNFDAEQKIKQIRLHWDQGTLLKQVEAIGKTGRNWPIRDGKAQIDAINKSLKSGGGASSAMATNGVRNQSDVVMNQHKPRDSVSTRRDPQEIFNPRDPNANTVGGSEYDGPRHAPRASAKPAPRDFSEMVAGPDLAPSDPGSKARSPSPNKADGVILKAGAGKHYIGNRLFDDSERSGAPRSPERKKVFDQKYQHFTFGDGEDAPGGSRPMSGSRSGKGAATFSFEDFATPVKHQPKARRDDVVQWGAEDPPSPPKRPVVHAARKDADSHFEIADDEPQAEKRKTLQHQQGMAIYDDPTAEENQLKKQSRNTAIASNTGRRGNDFGAHYSMTDDPMPDENTRPTSRGTRSDMSQNWSFGTPTEEKKIYKTAGDGMGNRRGANPLVPDEPEKPIYKTAGDGMGGRRGGSGRGWGIGDDSDIEDDGNIRFSARRRMKT